MIRQTIFSGLLVAILAVSGNYASADVVDSFDGGTVGSAPAGWQIKFDGASDQQALINVAADGMGGTTGLELDTGTAIRAYQAINQTGVSVAAGVGNTMTLTSDFQFSHTGGLTATNVPAFGLQIKDGPNWWTGTAINANFNRRNAGTGDIIGFSASPGLNGWNNATDFGLPAAGAAGQSDWFEIEIILTDNGTTYDAVYNLYNPAGSLVTTNAGGTAFTSGATLYGGDSTSWNNNGTDSIQTYSDIDDVNVDNFSFTTSAIPEPASAGLIALSMLGMVAFRRRRN